MAWVLLEVDFSEGLLEELELRRGTSAIRLNVDLWGVPFCYLECHETGHLISACPKTHTFRGRTRQQEFHGNSSEDKHDAPSGRTTLSQPLAPGNPLSPKMSSLVLDKNECVSLWAMG